MSHFDKSMPVNICKDFSLSGKCSFGNDCRFAHITPIIDTPILSKMEEVTLFVENIPQGSVEDDLYHLFSEYGKVLGVKISESLDKRDPFQRTMKLIGHVNIVGIDNALKAMKELNFHSNLRVNFHKTKEQRIPGSLAPFGGGAIRNNILPLDYRPHSRYASPPRTRIELDNPSYKTVYCKYDLNGKCTFGDQCSYLHTNEAPLVRGRSSISSLLSDRPLFRKTDYLSSIPPLSGPSYTPIICKYYERDGVCHHGNNCNFIHQVHAQTRSRSLRSSRSPSPARVRMTDGKKGRDKERDKDRGEEPPRDRIRDRDRERERDDREYYRRNEDRNEDRNDKYEKKINPEKYKTMPCSKWKLTGSCSYGDKCAFIH